MIAKEKYEDLAFRESQYGNGRIVGIRILAAGGPYSEAVEEAAREAIEAICHVIEVERWKADPEILSKAARQREELIGLFHGRDIFVETVENGYAANDPYWANFPWFKVTTNKGVITLGWRKRVISIDWIGPDLKSCKELFTDQDTTKFDGPDSHSGAIHAWGLEKAQEYLDKILA